MKITEKSREKKNEKIWRKTSWKTSSCRRVKSKALIKRLGRVKCHLIIRTERLATLSPCYHRNMIINAFSQKKCVGQSAWGHHKGKNHFLLFAFFLRLSPYFNVTSLSFLMQHTKRNSCASIIIKHFKFDDKVIWITDIFAFVLV